MNHLIIGNGVAGISAAIEIRKAMPESGITVITESTHLHYYRPKLIDYLADEVSLEKITTYKDDFYQKNNIRHVLGTRIETIDPVKKSVRDRSGSEYVYDRLLLATGGRPFIPPIDGAGHTGVFTVRGVADADRLIAYARTAKRIVIIGGGLLGLESANSLLREGKSITVIEHNSWLLPNQLDRESGVLLQGILGARGIRCRFDTAVLAIEGDGAVQGLLLANGERIPADAVIISAGIRADMGIAAAAGLNCRRGIVVDDHMRTSARDIFAAGDVAEHRATCYGIWTAAREQGMTAGRNMAGVETAYNGTLRSNRLKVTGVDLFSAGLREAPGAREYCNRSETSYCRLVVQDGKPVGAIVLGDREAAALAERVMGGRANPDDLIALMKA